jgi:S-formylglutathione hydrolase FrmB
MSTTKSVHRSIAILKLPGPALALVSFAQSVVTAMTGNPAFTTPTPSLAVVIAALNALQAAENAVLSRAHGAVVTRNDRRVALVTLMEQLKGYVQTTADTDLENSAAIIKSAGLEVRKTPTRAARAFDVKAGAVSGSARLVVPSAGDRSFYEWQTSIDGGKTWVPASSTLQAKTTITGLTPGSTVFFRYRPCTKAGEGDWSPPLPLLVR